MAKLEDSVMLIEVRRLRELTDKELWAQGLVRNGLEIDICPELGITTMGGIDTEQQVVMTDKGLIIEVDAYQESRAVRD